MFRCEICRLLTKPGSKQHKVVTHTRRDIPVVNTDRHYRTHRTDEPGKWVTDTANPGTQIVKEVNACMECANEASPPILLDE